MKINVNVQAYEFIQNSATKLDKEFLLFILNLLEIFPEIDEIGFVRISSKYLQQYKHNYEDYIKFLIDNKLMRCNGKYKVKDYPLGYRLDDINTIKSLDTIEIEISNIYNVSDAAQFQNEMLKKLTIDSTYYQFLQNLYNREAQRKLPKGYTDKLNTPMRNIGRKVSESKLTGRVYSPVTLMKKEFRSFLRLNGKELYEIDLSNSQPLFLYILIKENKPEILFNESVRRYYTDVVQGQLYENILHTYKEMYPKYSELERADIKLSVLGMFFSKDKNKKEEDTIYRRNTRNVFSFLYSDVYDFILETKEYKNNTLSVKLNNMESDIFINALYEVTQGNVEYVTCHDAVYTTSLKKDDLLLTIKNIFWNKYEIKPNIKLEKLSTPSVNQLVKKKHLNSDVNDRVRSNVWL